MSRAGEERPAATTRRTDLDSLRWLAVLCLIVFHTAKVFDADPLYHVKHDQPVAAATAITWWIRRWQMPLLFLISGWASATAAARLGRARFALLRARRLGLPLLLGAALLCPPIKWVELAGGRTLRPSGLRLVEPTEIGPLELLARFFGRLDHFTWSHLWFLVYLLAFTLVALPLLGRTPGRSRALSRTQAPVLAIAPIAPLVAIEAALRPRFGDYPNLYSDWANLTLFLAYFGLGIVLARAPAFEHALRRSRGALLALLVASTLAAAACRQPQLLAAVGAVVGWSAVAWALGAGAAVHWPETQRAVALRRSALAVYVLHHTPLVLLAFLVAGSALPLATQVLVIAGGTLTATAALVALCWLWPPTRRLLGLGPAAARPDPVSLAER